MYPESKKRFTLKIVFSYTVLGILALFASILIYTEFKNNVSSQKQDLSNKKLLKTNELLAQLYEAENLSKLALQTKKSPDIRAYSLKVDSINLLIDSLKTLAEISTNSQLYKLDSVQQLLNHKVYNNAELRKLKVQSEKNTALDSVLDAFHDMEVDMGRITPETFAPNFDQLSPKSQQSIKEYVAILNKYIPNNNGTSNANNIDSILEVSRAILVNAKSENATAEKTVLQKELQIYRNDLELSQKMRSLLKSFEDEMARNAFLEESRKEESLKRSTQFAGGAAALGLITIILFTILISKDYWKVQQYREQLEKAKKYSESLLRSREQLISTVSHDLRTPLNTITGYSDLIANTGLDQKQANYLDKIKSSSNYVEKLVSDLLDFSKLEADKIKIERIPFELNRLIKEVAGHFEEIQSNQNIKLQLDLAPDLNAPIISDPFRIRQILTNLIGNAFKFTEKGNVRVMARVQNKKGEPWLVIKVEDTGIGIPTEMQETIFQEFTQASPSDKQSHGGYGLGLTISRKLTQLLKGTLSLESKVGKGSVFTLQIPITFATKDTVEIPNPAKTTLPFRASLLVIDDDENLLGLISEVCLINQVSAQCYLDFNAVDLSKINEFDTVLTDIQMPRIDGFGVLHALREAGFTNPVIAMTGQEIGDKSTYLTAGFSEVLQKPFTAKSLLSVISTLEQKSTVEKIPQTNSEMFSIEQISDFLDGLEAVREVLMVFMDNNRKNLDLLFSSVADSDFQNIRAISHKMLPMFRQLEVTRAIPILEQLEKISDVVTGEKVYDLLVKLRSEITHLESEIQNYIVTHPIDTD